MSTRRLPRVSARRLLVLARASAKDLFAGQAAAVVVLALVAFALGGGEPRALDDAERRALALRQRIELVAAIAVGAAILGAAHAVEEGRRSQAFARLATTPATALETLGGRTLGVFGAVAAIALPVQLALLLLAEGGLLRRCEQFAPRSSIAPSMVELAAPDGTRSRLREGSRAPALLEQGATLTIRFDVEARSAASLELSVASASNEPAAQQLEWSLDVQSHELLRTHGATGLFTFDLSGGVLGRAADSAPAGSITPSSPIPPLIVTMRALGGDEVLRVAAADARIVGPPRSIAWSVARAIAGLLALLLLASALAAGLATLLPAALASAGAGCLLLLAALRSLFADVAASLHGGHAAAHAGDVHATTATETIALALGKVLSVLPDAARACGARPISTASDPWLAADAWALAICGVYALAAALLGAAWLRRGNAS